MLTYKLEDDLFEICDFKYVIKQLNLAVINNKKTVLFELNVIHYLNYAKFMKYFRERNMKIETILIKEKPELNGYYNTVICRLTCVQN